MLLHVGDNNFEQEVEKEAGLVLVDFWATWCGPCRMIAPIIDELSAEMPEIKFAKVDVDQNPNVSSKYRITSIPTLMVFKAGEVVDTIVGFRPKQELEQILRRSL